MLAFWNRFPWHTFAQFLSRNQALIHRAFGAEGEGYYQRNFTFESKEEAEAFCQDRGLLYIKNAGKKVPLCFYNAEEMKNFVISKGVLALHVGGTCLDGPKGRDWEISNELVSRPFVIDLDIDTTHRAATIDCLCELDKCCCFICWRDWVVPRAQIILQVLGTLGLKRILCVYSGRRGLHIWALDARAELWNTIQRTNVVGLIERKGVLIDKDVTLGKGHLCKCPLVPHVSTGKIAIPLEDIVGFDPSSVPDYKTVREEQLAEWANYMVNK